MEIHCRTPIAKQPSPNGWTKRYCSLKDFEVRSSVGLRPIFSGIIRQLTLQIPVHSFLKNRLPVDFYNRIVCRLSRFVAIFAAKIDQGNKIDDIIIHIRDLS